LVVSRASCRFIGGRMVFSLLANIVLPAPGGPISMLMGNVYTIF